MLVQAFVSCRLDYCSALIYGIKDNLLRRLQSIQNAAERFLTGARRRDHISPVLRHLHWLPVKQRVIYKLATVVYKSLHGQAVKLRRTWWTTASRLPSPVSRTCNWFGDRNFPVAGPRIWNSLPTSLRQHDIEFDLDNLNVNWRHSCVARPAN